MCRTIFPNMETWKNILKTNYRTEVYWRQMLFDLDNKVDIKLAIL